MNMPSVLQSLLDRIGSGASVALVYGEPVERNHRTIVPVAKVSYGFGGGTGVEPAEGTSGERQGSGGGGGVTIRPVGVIEVSDAGTRFVPIHQTPRLIGALFLGLLVGTAWGRRRARQQR